MLVGGKIGLTVKGMKNNVLACLSSVLNCIPLSFRICIYIYTRGWPKNQRKPCAGTPVPLDFSLVFGGGILNIHQPAAKVYLPNPGFEASRPSFVWCCVPVPSGKRLHNYGKSPLLMGKSTNSMAIFNGKPLVYQRVI